MTDDPLRSLVGENNLTLWGGAHDGHHVTEPWPPPTGLLRFIGDEVYGPYIEGEKVLRYLETID